jgi:hypothetical protein
MTRSNETSPAGAGPMLAYRNEEFLESDEARELARSVTPIERPGHDDPVPPASTRGAR